MKPDTSSVRFAVCGAAPASVELLESFESRYGIPIIEGYGLSEGSCASTVNPLTGKRKAGTVGLPLPGQTIRLVDASGHPVPDGEAGEVVIKGANVMRGYLNRPEETAKTIVGGWLHTGDVGRFDEDGYLMLVDRAKDMIIRCGENIYPREIEAVVHGLPEIAEAAVVGRAHPVYGEEPVLFVSLHSEGDARYRRDPRASTRFVVEIQTAGPDLDLGRHPEECSRQDRQAVTTQTTRRNPLNHQVRHIAKERQSWDLPSRNLPDVDPDTFMQKPLMERMQILATDWVDNGFGSPRIVHTIYIAKLVFLYALGASWWQH